MIEDTHEVWGLIPQALKAFHGGSRVMCSPAPTDTDIDYVILLGDWNAVGNAARSLGADGWTLGGSDFLHLTGPSSFQSWKKGELNFILTANADWYAKMKRATRLCRGLNEPDKAKRVLIFQAIVYGNFPT